MKGIYKSKKSSKTACLSHSQGLDLAGAEGLEPSARGFGAYESMF